MLIFYIHEVVKMDVEIAAILRKKATMLSKEALNDVSKIGWENLRKSIGVWCFNKVLEMVRTFKGVYFAYQISIVIPHPV